MMMRLNAQTLAQAHARTPAYDRAKITPGIVHLGIGNFHRAHQAVYVDDSLAEDPSWGIVGFSLRRPDVAEALGPQDGLYTVAEAGPDGIAPRVIGAVLEVVPPQPTPAALVAQLSDPAIRIVSLTITEKGYCHDPATGDLNLDHPGLETSAPALLVAALAARRAAGTAPFTVLSCDNLPANGAVLGRILMQMAARGDDKLAVWIEANVACPSSMVDRIVPATTPAARAQIIAQTGLDEAWPILTEPFRQWVIEDHFPTGRPSLPGAEFVTDVAPYEAMKLRMLNGAHSKLAYLGLLAGHASVADAMGDPALSQAVEAMWRDEVAPTLDPKIDTDAYAAALSRRFSNPGLAHKLAQIAMDGSQKVPQRFLATIRDLRRAGRPHPHLSNAVAGWIAYLAAVYQGRFDVDDPMSGVFADLARTHLPNMSGFAGAMLGQRAVFGDLRDDADFRRDIMAALGVLLSR